MNETRFEFKVGIFVFVGVALLALLILNFSKGITLFTPTYKLHVVLPTAAGLKDTADVMMAGVPIGKIYAMNLGPEGRTVRITLSILSKYKIRRDAIFHIDALGFLGDQYMEVSPPLESGPPPTNEMAFFHDGDTIIGEAPFNMQEAVRSVSGLLGEAKKTMAYLDQAITNVNHSVLSPETLRNFGHAVSNIEDVSEIAVRVANTAENLLKSNGPPIDTAIDNFKGFSAKLGVMADELDQTILTNRGGVNEAVQNLRDTSADFKQLAADLQAGKGVAGSLLKNEEMKAQLASILSNANTMAASFSTFGSNINERGLWSILWKPKHKEKPAEAGRH